MCVIATCRKTHSEGHATIFSFNISKIQRNRSGFTSTEKGSQRILLTSQRREMLRHRRYFCTDVRWQTWHFLYFKLLELEPGLLWRAAAWVSKPHAQQHPISALQLMDHSWPVPDQTWEQRDRLGSPHNSPCCHVSMLADWCVLKEKQPQWFPPSHKYFLSNVLHLSSCRAYGSMALTLSI